MSEATTPTTGKTDPPGKRRTSGETPAVGPSKSTSAPPPNLIGPSSPRPLRFQVAAGDRPALIAEATNALRSYRTDVAAWWVILDVEGESGPDFAYAGSRPARWVASIEATPIYDYSGDRYVDRRLRAHDDVDAFLLEVACPHDDDHRDPTSTAWAVSLDPTLTDSDGNPVAMSVTTAGNRGEDHVDQGDVRWLEAVIAREVTGQNPISRESALVEAVLKGVEAMRLTREYVDPSGQALPALTRWSWFDWINEAQDTVAALGYGFEEWRPVPAMPPQVTVPAPPSSGSTPSVGPKTGETAAVAPGHARPQTDGSELWDRRDGGTGGLGGDVTVVDQPVPTEVTLVPTDPNQKRRGPLARLADRAFGPVNPPPAQDPAAPAVGLSDLRD